MKIVVMSDTHLTQVTDEFEALCERFCHDADLVIHLGDMMRASILNFLERYPLEAVAGNMDDHVILSRLPTKKVLRVSSFRVGIIHGWGSGFGLRDRLHQEFSDVDAILFGHTHQPVQVRENGIFWFNPGSVTMGRGGSPQSLGILTIERDLKSEIISL